MKEDVNNAANTKGETDGQTLGRLKRIAIFGLLKKILEPVTFFQGVIFVVCNVVYNAWETYLLYKKDWL